MPYWTECITFVTLIIMIQPNMISPLKKDPNASSSSKDSTNTVNHTVTCSQLRLGQYLCNNTNIDPATQQPHGCSKETWTARITCVAVEGLICAETSSRNFEMEIPCKWTNGYKLDTALLMSVFLGVLGADRFYLGHLGMGALKFCTLGFLFIGQLVDIILLATQQIGPKDNSSFIIGYYGPGVTSIRANNLTYIVPRPDWF